MSKRDIIILIVIVLVLAGILFFLPFRSAPPSKRPPVTVAKVPLSELPKSFPANLPVDAVIKVVANYTATVPGGAVQATRSVLSSRSVQESFSFYKTFLSSPKNGWAIMAEVNDPKILDRKALFARNAGGVLGINISAGKAAGTSNVEVSFTAKRGS